MKNKANFYINHCKEGFYLINLETKEVVKVKEKILYFKDLTFITKHLQNGTKEYV